MLGVRQLKIILQRNCIDYRGCVEKTELMDRVKRLWLARKKEKGQWTILIYYRRRTVQSFYPIYIEMEKRINDTGDEGAALSPPSLPLLLSPSLPFFLSHSTQNQLSNFFHFPLSQFLHIHFTVCHISPSITMIVFSLPQWQNKISCARYAWTHQLTVYSWSVGTC